MAKEILALTEERTQITGDDYQWFNDIEGWPEGSHVSFRPRVAVQ